MKHLFLFGIVLVLMLTGCGGVKDPPSQDHVDLIVYSPDKIDVKITKRQWEGFWGPEGYIGLRADHYVAGLRGSGPTYKDPLFLDNPPDIECIGTITLDREHNKVIVDMHRIVSRPGEPQRTKPHPANGTYSIQSTRAALPNEPPLEPPGSAGHTPTHLGGW